MTGYVADSQILANGWAAGNLPMIAGFLAGKGLI
jgi:hypothetical protein